MGRWTIENRAWQQVLTHYCDRLRAGDTNQVLRQDIGGGYIRCERCGETHLPETAPGDPRLLLRVQEEIPAQAVVSQALPVAVASTAQSSAAAPAAASPSSAPSNGEFNAELAHR